MYRPLCSLIASITLTACGGNNEATDPTSPEPRGGGAPIVKSVSDYKLLAQTDIQAKVLKPATKEVLRNHLQNGLRLRVNIGPALTRSAEPAMVDLPRADDGSNETATASGDSNATNTDSDGASGNFSSTNTHVANVDESDFVKYDGEYMYLASGPEYVNGEKQHGGKIRILASDATNASINEVSEIVIEDGNGFGSVNELYLLQDGGATSGLVTLRSSAYFHTDPTIDTTEVVSRWFLPPQEHKVALTIYDVKDRTAPTEAFNVEIDGTLKSSRKIDNTLYLVTSYSPYLPFIDYYFETTTAAEENEKKIAELSLDQMLPGITVNNGEKQPLLNAEDCLVPTDLSANYGYQQMLSIIAIDLDSQQLISTKCLNTEFNGIYATRDALYIGGSSFATWEAFESFTVVHKFELGEAISYRSTGVVPGALGWTDPSFRMDAYNGDLRIVTTRRSDNFEPVHHLSILRDAETSDEMVLVSQLPNESEPAPIGKPFEDIYAVRFMGDRGFVVTFQQIDPLYVLDLADAENPKIAGELEVPGFSNYLHPVGDSYLLGVGQDVSPSGASLGGVKVSLFDITDITAPSLMSDKIFGHGGSWTQALSDLRAISFLDRSADQLRFALPVSLYGPEWKWQEDALHLMEINGLTTTNTSLDVVGKITSESATDTKSWPSYTGIERSVLHDEAVYYVHGNSVWASYWSTPEAATGPH